MVGLVFSLDYEIYGTGAGDFRTLMLEPTDRLLDIFNEHSAKLTIMAEVAEILAIRKHNAYRDIAERIDDQLKRALSQGHDVQLHLHPAWFNARYEDGNWILDYGEYSLAHLSTENIQAHIDEGKAYLEGLGSEVLPDYRCVAFRAGNWLIQPSGNIVECLERAGLEYDTSVFKGGFGSVGPFSLDYRSAHSNIMSWVVDPHDINRMSDRKGLREIPILSRDVLVTSMVTAKRLRLQKKLLGDSQSPVPQTGQADIGIGKRVGRFRLRCPKKFDFCRLTLRELKSFLRYAVKQCGETAAIVPVVAIGHSTEIHDERTLRGFLRYVGEKCGSKVTTTTFLDCARRRYC